MSSLKSQRAKWRALLTDTLPYEVPVIFSNDRRYAALVTDLGDGAVAKAFQRVVTASAPGTIPYQYTIAKERNQRTALGIIHPVWQMRISEFYEAYAQSLLDYCGNAEFSLRRPIEQTPLFSDAEMAGGKTFKLGIPHVDPKDGEMDVSHVVSYFAYGRYNLLSKFIESREFLDLEKRFDRLRTLDVSKCFFSIYTHTITWAVKEKTFAKTHRNAYSFEGRFDDLMQKANYNETHGIVVGPEVSRIFAEIIFQDVDRQVERTLRTERSFVHGRDYAIRRYVDDYFVFARTEAHLDAAEHEIRKQLEKYKLYLNDKKVVSHTRPFVSSISLARREIAILMDELNRDFEGLLGIQDEKQWRERSRLLRQQIREIRFIAAKHEIGLHTVSGWLLSSMRRVLVRVTQAVKKAQPGAQEVEYYTDIAADVLEVAFYICALDARVRTSYSLCQLLSVLGRLDGPAFRDHFDRLKHVASEGLQSLINNLVLKHDGFEDSIELCNLLICGAHYVGPDFLRSEPAGAALQNLIAPPVPTYFAYATAKFCMLKDAPQYSEALANLNDRLIAHVMARKADLALDAQLYLLFCDLLSAPDLSVKQRRRLFVEVFGGSPTKKTIATLAALVGFIDWSGVQIEHLLRRKQLRPVYSFA